jgi:acetyl-CoA carboxylase biotin carboxyl carrier protein
MADGTMTVDEKTARKLIKVIKGRNIAELSVTEGNTHITVKKKPNRAKVIVPAASLEPQSAVYEENAVPVPKNTEEQKVAEIVRSELIGRFSLADGNKLLAEEGKTYEKGVRIGLIMSMKLANEIKTPVKCRLNKVLVKDKEIVDYGKPLFEIEPL